MLTEKNTNELEIALKFLQEGGSIPFLLYYGDGEISENYTPESLGEALEKFQEKKKLASEKNRLINKIKSQNKLYADLERKIQNTTVISELTDLFLPYQKEKQTLATQAKQSGLEELANWIWDLGHGKKTESKSLEEKAKEFIKEDSPYKDEQEVLKGVKMILVERIAEVMNLRSHVRNTMKRRGTLLSSKGVKTKEKSKYSKYFNYREPVRYLYKHGGNHRYLLMCRGASSNELTLSIQCPDKPADLKLFEEFACTKSGSIADSFLLKLVPLALTAVYTAIEHETFKDLKELAEKNITKILLKNLRKKLLRAPFGKHAVLSIDYENDKDNCTIALVGADGKPIIHNIFSMKTEEDWKKFQMGLTDTLNKLKVSAITISNSPKSKKIQEQIQKNLQDKSCPIFTIYDQSLNIYATSSIAKEEFPNENYGARRAIFFARYLQNPIQELVKIAPKFLMMDAFQFNINMKKINKSVYETIQNVVCAIGVDINDASPSLLSYVPSLNHELGKEIVQNRKEHGNFSSLENIKRVPSITDLLYKQVAGFLKISQSKNVLERTRIHPDHFYLIEEEVPSGEFLEISPKIYEKIKKKLGNRRTLFIQKELQNMGKDLRGKCVPINLHVDTPIDEVRADQEFKGIVTSITNFGVFVDVGLEQDGLIHISEFSTTPYEKTSIAETITVWVKSMDLKKKQLSFTIKSPEEKQRIAQRLAKRIALRKKKKENSKLLKSKKRESQKLEKKKEEKKRPPQRDPKTGAIMKSDDSIYTSQRRKKGEKTPKFQTKAKVTTFNPFADLGEVLKNKIK